MQVRRPSPRPWLSEVQNQERGGDPKLDPGAAQDLESMAFRADDGAPSWHNREVLAEGNRPLEKSAGLRPATQHVG